MLMAADSTHGATVMHKTRAERNQSWVRDQMNRASVPTEEREGKNTVGVICSERWLIGRGLPGCAAHIATGSNWATRSLQMLGKICVLACSSKTGAVLTRENHHRCTLERKYTGGKDSERQVNQEQNGTCFENTRLAEQNQRTNSRRH
jgi:hypothetical protein